MVAEEGEDLCQKLDDPQLNHRDPGKVKSLPVKIDRSRCMADSTRSPTLPSDPNRKRKFNGTEKRAVHFQDDVNAKDKASHHRLQNGAMEKVEQASSSEKRLQENVMVSCSSKDLEEPIQNSDNNMELQDFRCKDPNGNMLPATTSSLDENSNVMPDESDCKRKRLGKEDDYRPVSSCPVMATDVKDKNTAEPKAFLSLKISEHKCRNQPGDLPISDDLPKSRKEDEEMVEQRDGGKAAKLESDGSNGRKEREKDSAIKSSKKDDQHLPKPKEKRSEEHKSDKRLKERDEEIKKKGVHDRREKEVKEKDKVQEKINDGGHTIKDKIKKESENRLLSYVDKEPTEEKPDVVSMAVKGEMDTSNAEKPIREPAIEGKPTKSNKPKDVTEKRHKDHSRSKDKGAGIDEDKRKNHSEKGKTKDKDRIQEEKFDLHMLNKEHEHDLKGSTMKRTLVDLDLFQVTLTDDRKQKTKDKTKGKSHDKVQVNKGSEEKDKPKKGDDKGKKSDKDAKKPHDEKRKDRTKDSEETKVVKREREDLQEELEAGHKKSKHDTEMKKPVKVKEEKNDRSKKGKVSTSKKRKNGEEEEKTKAKKTKEEESKWKWWEEDNYEDGVKWKFLEHRGPYFAPPYEPLPDDVLFYYDGQPMKLSLSAEEVATFYGKMLDHEYTSKEAFQNNFFTDWKSQMTKEERKTIKHLDKCGFSEIHKYFFEKNEARKALPKGEKQKLKEETNKIQEEYGYCMLDGHREKIGNFKTEPPGLFRGRGDHPKMGMLKMRIKPEDVIINCSKESKVPDPPPGHKWKEVRFDNTVTWLASWTENIQSSIKYIMLNPSSKLKGEKDWQKYEMARRLKSVVDQIRSQYRLDWKSREMKKRQRAVALYFIDKLALRAGNEKEEGETADTVGCCSLRVEHIKLYPELDGQQYMVEFDFLGKDSIRYYNKVPVEKEVFKNLKLFMENKNPDDDLFDRLNTSIVNKHLQDLMDGLTAKVFRTYNASITLQIQLKELTNEEDNVAAKILSYNRANRAVALLCNHQRALPKTFEKSMQNLQAKIDAKEQQLREAKKELKKAKADHKAKQNDRTRKELEKKKKQVERLEEQLMKLKLQATDKEENKQVALGTSKLNYLDPRITVAWCKKYGVPIEKIYNKTQREKFAWAIDMTSEDFEF